MRHLCAAILLLFSLALPMASQAQVICISNVSPPPELPVYEQPPTVGLLWTPGYWGWRDGIYIWSAGYWGPHIGFYGGVDYGFGYGGVGYEGGRWENGVFAYNRTVNNFGGVTITNVYEKTVIVEPGAARVSFNGGSGGTTVRPTPEEEAAAHEQHVAAIPAQLQHERTASANPTLLASENHGHPAIAATSKPGEFTGKGVVAAREVTPSHTLPSVKPAGAAAIDKNPTGPSPQVVKPNAEPGLAKLPNTKPDGAVAPDHAGSRTLDKKEPANDQAKQNTGSIPKSSNIEAKPLPQPSPAAAVKPPPPPPAKPALATSAKPPPPKPACPPGKTMTPSGCK